MSIASLPNFWDNNHPLAAQAEALCTALIPDRDNCDTLQGEFLRASSKISYDWYNNGWGCNNWSGAVVFLQKFVGTLPNPPAPEVLKKLDHELNYVHDYSHGEPAPHNDERAEFAIVTIHEIVVQAVLDNPTAIVNTRDMFDFQEEAHRYEEDEDDGFGW